MAQFITRKIVAEATALFCGTFPGAVAVNTTRLDTNIQALHHGGKINLAGFFFIFNCFCSFGICYGRFQNHLHSEWRSRVHSMPDITNRMMIVKINHIQPKEGKAALIHGLHISVVIGASELKDKNKCVYK